MRDLKKLVPATYHTLLDNLIDNRTDAEAIVNEICFLRQQELHDKRDVWVNMPGEGVQMRDRAASYAVTDTVAEIIRLEGELEVITFEHEVLVRLIDGAR